MFALLEVEKGAHHGLHPGDTGAQVSGDAEVIVPQSLLKLLSHLLEVGEVACSLHTSVERHNQNIVLHKVRQ